MKVQRPKSRDLTWEEIIEEERRYSGKATATVAAESTEAQSQPSRTTPSHQRSDSLRDNDDDIDGIGLSETEYDVEHDETHADAKQAQNGENSSTTRRARPQRVDVSHRYPPGEPLFGRGQDRREATMTVLGGGLSTQEKLERKAHLERIGLQHGVLAKEVEKKRIRKMDTKRRKDRKAHLDKLEPYLRSNLQLIRLEAEEERKTAELQHSWTDERLKREGVLLQGLEGYWLRGSSASANAEDEAETVTTKTKRKRKTASAASMFRTAVFHRPGKNKLGWTRLQKGDQVELKATTVSGIASGAESEETDTEGASRSYDEPEVWLASIKSITQYEVRLTFQEPPVNMDLLAHATWRISQTYNDRIEKRLRESVAALMNDVGSTQRADAPLSGTYLVDVLLEANRVKQPQDVAQAPIMQWIKQHRPNVPPPNLDNLTESQRRAVDLMLNERMSLIQGPPGTGKTHTIVTAITVLKKHYNIPHPILLTSHTNVAVDNMAQGCMDNGLNVVRAGTSVRVRDSLSGITLEGRMEDHPLKRRLDDNEAYRIELIQKLQLVQRSDASHEEMGEIKKQLARTIWRSQYLRRGMEADILAEADVVCCTALSVPTIAGIDFPLVFFDEATMATEPITLATMIKGCQQMSLIGDHKQLSPLIRSRDAQAEGLGQSMFERLMARGDLQSVMLDTQHRMHPALSAFSSKEFYDGRLQDGASTFTTTPLRSSFVPAKTEKKEDVAVWSDAAPSVKSAAAAHQPGFLTFVHHTKPERVASSKSLENVAEAQLVVSITADLLARNPDLRGRDIAILTPYAGQRQLLSRSLQEPRSALRQRFARELERLGGAQAKARISELPDIEVETIDGFEGREKRAIVFSMVRNNAEQFWGFLLEHKRWNVALTRARNGMWILGSMDMLEHVDQKAADAAAAAAAAAAVTAESTATKTKKKQIAAGKALLKDADEVDGVAEALARKTVAPTLGEGEHAGFIARFARHLREHDCVVEATSLFPKAAVDTKAATTTTTPTSTT